MSGILFISKLFYRKENNMHLFIDTNIYMFCALLTKNNHEPSLLRNLLKLLEEDKMILIVPEVVELEFYRKLDQEFEKLKKSIKKSSKEFNKIFPSYLEEDKQRINNQIKDLVNLRKKSIKEVKKIYNEILGNDNTQRIKLSEKIITNSYRRSLRGLKPSSVNNHINGTNPDTLIIESIIKYNKNNSIKQLIFCSDNINDFAEFDQNTNSHILHKDIFNSLHEKTIFYRKLTEVLKNEFNEEINEDSEEKINEVAEELRLDEIIFKWEEILSILKRKRIKLYAFLLEGKPVKIKNDELTIQYRKYYTFHKENIEKYTDIIEDIIFEVTGKKISLNFIIDDSGF